MTNFDQKRRWKIVKISMACAGALCLSVQAILLGFMTDPFMLLCCFVAMVSAGISTNFYWKKLQKSGETKRRGALYGALIGIVSLILMSFIVSAFSSIFNILKGDIELIGFAFLLLIGPIYMSVFGFVFGGFLVIPIGAITGYVLAKNPNGVQTSNPPA